MREGIFEEAAPAGLARDPPVDQLVERAAERALIPTADLTQDVARELHSDIGCNFGRGAGVGREPLHTMRYQGLQILRRESAAALPIIIDELCNEQGIS